VKGHQDELLSASSLPHLTQLNILADQLAKQSILCLLQHHQRWVGLLVWSLQVNTQTVTSDPHPCIIQHLGYHAAYKYIVEKSSISPLQDLPRSTSLPWLQHWSLPLYGLWFSKFVSGHSATGHMMCLWGNGTMLSALVVAMTQKQPDMSSSVLTLHASCISLPVTDLWARAGICRYNARYLVLPAPRSPHGAILPPCFLPLQVPLHRQQPKHRTAFAGLTSSQTTHYRMVWFTTLPFV